MLAANKTRCFQLFAESPAGAVQADVQVVQRQAGRRGRVFEGSAVKVHALGIPVAEGVLYPVFGALLSPIIRGVAMSLSSVSVIANALRLRNTKS